jgi:hypothetical protein
MGTTDVTCQKYGKRHTQAPYQTNLEDAVILAKKHCHCHTTATQESENKCPHQLTDKIFHRLVLLSVFYYGFEIFLYKDRHFSQHHVNTSFTITKRRCTITKDVQGGIWDGEWRMNDVSGNDKIEAQSQDNSVPLYIIMCNLMKYNR